MRIYVQRVSWNRNGWLMQFSAAGTNAVTGNLVTSVLLGNETGYDGRMTLPEALNEGAKLARGNFEAMRKFNSASEAHS